MFKIPEETIEAIKGFVTVAERVSNMANNIGKLISERLSEIDFKKWSETLSIFAQEFEKLSEKQRKVVDELTKCAWYMNSENGIYIINEILNLDKEDNKYIENIDKIMLEDLKQDENKKYELILDSFQNRKAILLDAIEDHKIGRYNCCIPIFLNQIDGITRDLFGIDKRNNFF